MFQKPLRGTGQTESIIFDRRVRDIHLNITVFVSTDVMPSGKPRLYVALYPSGVGNKEEAT
jgi:hypothetical protein